MSAKTKIAEILRIHGFLPPEMKFIPAKWKTLRKQYESIWGCDFTTIYDIGGYSIFVFCVIDWTTREIISVSATYNPTRDWICEQFSNALEQGHIFPEALVLDNDQIFGKWIAKHMRNTYGTNVNR